MPDLPTGTVTLLFTDIEGSTELLQRLGTRYGEVLAECRSLLRSCDEQGINLHLSAAQHVSPEYRRSPSTSSST